MSAAWRNSLQSLAWFMRYWRDNFTAAYDLNRIFLIGSDNLCMASRPARDVPIERDQALKVLHQRIEQYRNAPAKRARQQPVLDKPGRSPRWLFLRPDAGLYGRSPAGDAGRGADHPHGKLIYAGQFADERDDLDDNGQPLRFAGRCKVKSRAKRSGCRSGCGLATVRVSASWC